MCNWGKLTPNNIQYIHNYFCHDCWYFISYFIFVPSSSNLSMIYFKSLAMGIPQRSSPQLSIFANQFSL